MEKSDLHFCELCEKGCPQLLRGLSRESLREWQNIVRTLDHVRYDKGETIFHEGMPAVGVYIVCTGVVKVMKRHRSGKSQIVKLVGPSELLGEESLFGEAGYSSYSQAFVPSEVKFIDRTRFLDFLRRHQEFGLQLTGKLADEVRVLQDRWLESSYDGSREKVARILLIVAREYGKPDENGHLHLEMARLDLGQMAGATQETVIRALSRFQERGFLQLDNHRIIIDPKGLEKQIEPFSHQLNGNLT